jgi:hypothetical protein
MRNIFIGFLMLFFVITGTLISSCGSSNSPTAAAPTPTPTPYVTFQITNNKSTFASVYQVGLVRNSTSVNYHTNCSIPDGATISVSVTIPANDSYDVYISDTGSNSDIWYATSLSLGTTYIVNLPSSSCGTLNSVTAGVCNFE